MEEVLYEDEDINICLSSINMRTTVRVVGKGVVSIHKSSGLKEQGLLMLYVQDLKINTQDLKCCLTKNLGNSRTVSCANQKPTILTRITMKLIGYAKGVGRNR